MKLDLIELTEENVPEVEVIAFDENGHPARGIVLQDETVFGGFAIYLKSGFTYRNLTHYAHIPNLSQESETVNPVQSLIDEYMELMKETQEQIDELKKKQRTSNFPDMYHKRIQTAETQLTDYQQFISKLEGLL